MSIRSVEINLECLSQHALLSVRLRCGDRCTLTMAPIASTPGVAGSRGLVMWSYTHSLFFSLLSWNPKPG